MSKDEYTLLFEQEEQQLSIEELALVDGKLCDEDVGVWQIWARYQRGYAIARRIHVGQSVHALYWHKTGYWGFVNYKVTHIVLQDECTIDNMSRRKEYIVVTNKYGKVRQIPLHALGYTVLTTMKYAQRAAAIRNAQDCFKVLQGTMNVRMSNY